jgi:NAD(P)H dehydrogenase (quinone)
MKKVLIINGHPNSESYCTSLTKAYTNGSVAAGNEVVVLNLFDLKFNINFEGTYSKESNNNLEADLVFAQEKIKWAQHIVVIHPVWWGSVPAILKGFFDRTLLPGFAFKYKKDSAFWDMLLIGKTASIIYTSDTPPWFYKLFYRVPSINMVRDRVLGFCGIKTISVTGIGPIRNSTQTFREDWIIKIEKLAQKIS